MDEIARPLELEPAESVAVSGISVARYASRNRQQTKMDFFRFVLTWRATSLRNSLIINRWLPRKDSNLDKEIQNLWCYHYTTRQAGCGAKPKAVCGRAASGG